MKKVLILTVCFFAFCSSYAVDIILYRHKKGCFIGCNDVIVERAKYTLPDGTMFDGVKIKCFGFGFSGCPGLINPNETVIDAFDAVNANNLMSYSLLQIENGNASGDYAVQVLNTTTNQLFVFRVQWNTSGTGENYEEEITVTKTLVQ